MKNTYINKQIQQKSTTKVAVNCHINKYKTFPPRHHHAAATHNALNTTHISGQTLIPPPVYFIPAKTCYPLLLVFARHTGEEKKKTRRRGGGRGEEGEKKKELCSLHPVPSTCAPVSKSPLRGAEQALHADTPRGGEEGGGGRRIMSE